MNFPGRLMQPLRPKSVIVEEGTHTKVERGGLVRGNVDADHNPKMRGEAQRTDLVRP